MEQYNITGMSCAACSSRVEKAVSKVDGVTSCSVSLLTNSMGVEGDASINEIIRAVENAGYGASAKSTGNNAEGSSKTSKGKASNSKTESADSLESMQKLQIITIRNRLISSLVFLILLMYLSMGHIMLGFPLLGFLQDNPIGIGIIEMLLAGIVMVINQRFFVSGTKALCHGAPNMDTLVALGSMASYVWSVYSLVEVTVISASGSKSDAMALMNNLYFESAAMILTLITVGKLLESISKGRTTSALTSLIKLAPQTAHVISLSKELTIPADELKPGDRIIIRPGEAVPADAVVEDGSGAVNESMLTGESIPSEKKPGDRVSTGTINQEGFLTCKVTATGENTSLSQIISMVSDAAATKAPISRIADKVAGIFVPVIIGIALITFIIWMLTGAEISFALSRGIAVLVISCPCALGLATPVAIMVGNGLGARNGILFKTAAALEAAGKADIIVFDKTGTITNGTPTVTDVIPLNNYSESELLSISSALERKSEHPLAKAVISYNDALESQNHQNSEIEITDFKAVPGNGLCGKIEGTEVYGGSQRYISDIAAVNTKTQDLILKLSGEGKTILLFAKEKELIGIIAAADKARSEAQNAVNELKNMGIKSVLLSGDNKACAEAVGAETGIEEVISDVLPAQKAEVIERLKQKGKVIMVGDGINDAPALTGADIGIAIGAGTDVAIDAADIVLMNSNLLDVPAAVRLSRATIRNIHENLFWAFFYNIIGIPLAAGAFIPAFGIALKPMFGAAAMSLSSFLVVTNALRLNFAKVHDNRHDRQLRHRIINNLEEKEMTRTMKIEGMMCEHCQARVKKALEALPQVTEANVSFKEGTAVVSISEKISDEELTNAVTAQDYKVISID